MAANGKIVIDADHGKVDAAADRTAKKYKQIGDNASGVGKEMSQWGNQAAKTLVGVSAVLGAIRAAGQELKRLRDENINAGKDAGAAALARGKNIRALGVDIATGGADRAEAALSQAGGAASQDQIDAFVASLAGRKKEERPSARQTLTGVQLLRTGVFSEQEIGEVINSDRGLQKLSSQRDSRLSRLSTTERQELPLLGFELANEQEIKEKKAADATRARVTRSTSQLNQVNNPTAAFFTNTVNASPLGSVVPVQDIAETALGLGGNDAQISRTLRQIKSNTAPIPRPNLNTDAGGRQ